MLKNDHVVFVYVDRAQTEQKLNLVHDRSVNFTFNSHFPFSVFFSFLFSASVGLQWPGHV